MKIIIFSFLIMLASCITPGPTTEHQVLDFGSFTIEGPSNWQKIDKKGIDSYVGGIKLDSNEAIEFDLGWYSNKLTGENQVVSWDIIDNRKAKIVTPNKTKVGITGVYIDSLWINGSAITRFNLYGKNLNVNNSRLVLQAIKTLKFHNPK